MAEAGGWGTQRKKACIRHSILYSNTWPLPLLITAMLRYVLWYCSSRSALISFFFTFRLVVKQRTPSFIILSKESSFRASFLQRYQVERWQKFRTVPYLTQLSSGKIELAFVRSSWKKNEELPILVVQSKHRARADKHSISRPSSAGCYAPTSSWCQAIAVPCITGSADSEPSC